MKTGFLKSLSPEVKWFALAAVLAVITIFFFFPRKLSDTEINRDIVFQSENADEMIEAPVPEEEQVLSLPGSFFVQMFAFSDQDKARAAGEALREKGVRAEIREGESGGSIVYRIWAGGFETRKDAEDAILSLREISPKAFIVHAE